MADTARPRVAMEAATTLRLRMDTAAVAGTALAAVAGTTVVVAVGTADTDSECAQAARITTVRWRA